MKSAIRVLHVVSGDLYAGAERIVEELAIAQHARLKLRVTGVVLNDGQLAKNLSLAGIETHVLDETRLSAQALLSALRKLVRETGAQIVHTHRFKENVLGGLAAIGLAPSLRTVHGAPEFSRARNLRDRVIDGLDRFAANRLQSRVVAVSEELAARLRGIYRPSSIATVTNGIDAERVRTAANVEVPALAGEIRLGVFARLVAVKRVGLAIEVARRVRERLGKDVVLHIFGDGALEATLRAEARGDSSITFHGNTQQAPAYMRQMHALLMTSSHEGLPVAVLEAMALSVPVVATRTGGIPYVLDEGQGGWLADAGDTNAYVLGAAEAVSPGEQRTRKTLHALQRLERELSATRMAQDYLDLYQSLVFHRGHRARAQSA